MTNEPLTEEQKVLGSGQVLPSGESNFYDFSQDHSYNDGSGINVNFPSPSNFIDASGTIRTYPPDLSPLEQSGIFAADNLKTAFSNSENAALSGITDFTIFNNYVHYATGESLTSVQIPYLSDYTISTGFNPYVF